MAKHKLFEAFGDDIVSLGDVAVFKNGQFSPGLAVVHFGLCRPVRREHVPWRDAAFKIQTELRIVYVYRAGHFHRPVEDLGAFTCCQQSRFRGLFGASEGRTVEVVYFFFCQSFCKQSGLPKACFCQSIVFVIRMSVPYQKESHLAYFLRFSGVFRCSGSILHAFLRVLRAERFCKNQSVLRYAASFFASRA